MNVCCAAGDWGDGPIEMLLPRSPPSHLPRPLRPLRPSPLSAGLANAEFTPSSEQQQGQQQQMETANMQASHKHSTTTWPRNLQ